MDCHVFRRLCDELGSLLQGARIEKIASPAPGLTTFLLYHGGHKSTLFLCARHKNPFVFLSETRLQNPAVPTASVMRLRKHCQDHRITEILPDWPYRRLFLRVNADGAEFPWLELDLKDGPKLLGNAPEVLPVTWPADSSGNADWRDYPMLTPVLRRTLGKLDAPERDALWEDLKLGGGDLFITRDANGSVTGIAAWPDPGDGAGEPFTSAIKAARLYGEKVIIPETVLAAGREALKKRNTTLRKLDKLLEKTKEDRLRLQTMCEGKRTALALQAELYRFRPDMKVAKVRLEGFADPVQLNPTKTVRENMEHLFRQADRGLRGLEILSERVEQLSATRDGLIASIEADADRGRPAEMPVKAHQGRTPVGKWPRNIQCFRSDDGFRLLRGRDATGNLALLRMTSPNDIWMHIGGAAGAHVAIRLDHALQEIPEMTLAQAARLAVEKSERRGEASADVIYARMKHIKPIKGSRIGAVNIAELLGSITVDMEGTPSPAPISN